MSFDTDMIPGELMTYHAVDGVELQGFMVKSKKRTGKVVVHIHGLTGNFFRSATVKRMIPHYLSAGYDFFLINTRGYGIVSSMYRVKGKKVKRILSGGGLEKFEDCVKDLQGVVNFLRSRKYRKIVLIGHSTGCQKATYYMYKTKDRRIAAVVLLAPADDYNIWKKDLKKKWGFAAHFAKKMAKKRPNDFMPRGMIKKEISSVQRFNSLSDLDRVESRIFNYESKKFIEFSSLTLPVMAIFGNREPYKTKPVRVYLRQLRKATHSKKFAASEIRDADHNFKGCEKETAKTVVNWLNEVV